MTDIPPNLPLRAWLLSSGTRQSHLAQAVGVSRAAVSKWCSGDAQPSLAHAILIEAISEGALPSTIWTRKKHTPTVAGETIRSRATDLGLTIIELAQRASCSHRSLARWAAGEYIPRRSSIERLNEGLGLQLTQDDFRP